MDRNQELEKKILEIRLLENQIVQLEQQIGLLNQQVIELQSTQADLDTIQGVKEQEALVPLGKDIFIRSKLEPANKVLINIGAKVVIKKDIAGAKKILEKQKQRFLNAREEIGAEIDNMLSRIATIEKGIKEESEAN